ncbi:unnamed protein product [Arabidopsis halleri]
MADSSVMKMTVKTMPASDLAFTNLAYCSPSDLHSFAVPGSTDLFLANVGEVFSISDGSIALNSIQRRHARVSAGDNVYVTRFIPPENFDLTVLTVDLEFVKRGTKNEQIDATLLSTQLKKKFINQVLTLGQRVTFEYHGTNYILTVNRAVVLSDENQTNGIERGMIGNDTYFVFEASNASGIKIINQREAATSKIFKEKEFNLQSLGIGGLNAEFVDIFRRAFASRIFPPHLNNRLGAKHVKGMLLFGPPGTGKTLIARQIGKMLNGKEPKIVNGPEVLSKFVGETEKNVRDLFADAENDQRTLGDDSELHVIIFDEIDAICKSRGSSRDGTGVHDSIVNQLLTKIDGVEALNNVLLIGMTNRKDMLDEALLRPGRLEVHIEIGLPDDAGRFEILQIHTKMMKENSFLAPDVNLQELGMTSSIILVLDLYKIGGKTVLAATVGMASNFPYVKIVSAETLACLQESTKSAHIAKVFEDAYKSPMSIVILDNIERSFLKAVGLHKAFSVTYSVPLLRTEDAKKVLKQLNVFSEDDIEEASKALNDIPIKQLYFLIEMAAPRDGRSKESIYTRKEKLNITHFFDCLQEVTGN